MFRYQPALAALMIFGMLVGRGMTQGPAGKDKKDAKDPPVKQPAEPDTFKDDLKIVRESGLKGEGPDLLEYFRKKTLKQPDPKEIAALAKHVADEEFGPRERPC